MSPDKIVVDKDEAEELPPGWKIEVRLRKQPSVKKDRFYTDPVTGYVFRSLRDVHRYLKTGRVGRLAYKPKNGKNGRVVDRVDKYERLHNEESSESNEHMNESLRRKRPLDMTGNAFSVTWESELLQRVSKRPAGIDIYSPLPLPTFPEPKTHQDTGLASVKVDASPIPQPKTHRATRQAGIKIDSPPPSPPDTRNSLEAMRERLVNLASQKKNEMVEKIAAKHNENADVDYVFNDEHEKSSAIPPVNQEGNQKQEPQNILPQVTPKEPNKETEMGTETPGVQAPQIVPPVDFEKQKAPVANTAVSNPILQDGYGYRVDIKSDSSVGFSRNDLWAAPCMEFAVRTLTGAIPSGDMNKPEKSTPLPLKEPLEELWTDPCIEFAVKTLTGAIPVVEDDYLPLRPPASIRKPVPPHDFYLPDVSFCQTDVLSKRFEAKQNKQQDSAFGNGGLQKSRKYG